MNSLPAVAKSFLDECTKCGGDKFHRVLAHLDENSAKVECEICGKKKTFRLQSKAKNPKSSSKTGSATAARAKAGEWLRMVNENGDKAAKSYSVKEKFQANDKIAHPTFGTGYVMQIQGDRMITIFEDSMRTLVHSRS